MFRILNHVDKLSIVRETTTHYVARCPVCGDDNLKIKKTSPHKGAYKCWSHNCTGEDMRQKLGIKRSLLAPKNKKPLVRLKPRKVPFTGTHLLEVFDYQPLQPKIKKFSAGYTTQETLYPYSETQRVLRIDNLQTKTKYVFIQYLSEDFTWISGAGTSIWPVYTHGVEHVLQENKADTVLFVEGEKTAEFVKERGLVALTLMSSGFYLQLDKTLMLFRLKYPHIRNIFFVPDFDDPGLDKATKFQLSCWRNQLACSIIPMSSIVPNPYEGMDLADLDETLFLQFKNADYFSRDRVDLATV